MREGEAVDGADAGRASFARTWREIVGAYLKLGATAYGGPAIMGIMQAELEAKRRWVSRERFVEGLSLVNMFPGATATMLGIFLAYARGGWWGGLVGGLCFVLPGFAVMLALTIGYAALGVTPVLRGALYGLGPVVLGIFAVAIYRLGRSTVTTAPQAVIAVAAAGASIWSPLGVAVILLMAGAAGLFVFHGRRAGLLATAAVVALVGVAYLAPSSPGVPAVAGPAGPPGAPGLGDVAAFFFKVGAFTVGGGLTMIAFIQDQVVEQLHWLTPREFIDGLALGQFTPGPVLMLAAYVGYKVAGVAGAAVAAGAAFLPSFIIMLAVLPMLDRVRRLTWARAVMRGMGPAVIGVLPVALARLAPHAVPDVFAAVVLVATVVVLLAWRVGTLKLMVAGAVLGVVRARVLALPLRAARELGSWARV
jgi:chromate transporter